MMKRNVLLDLPQEELKRKAIRIFFMTDLHILSSVDGNPETAGAVSGSRKYYRSGGKMDNWVNIVNLEQPNAAIVLGDTIDEYSDASADLFMSKWNQITITKAITIGNHDIYKAAEPLHDTVALKFGYSGNAKVAGSKFNQSFVLSNDYMSVLVLMLDTNIDANGNHVVTEEGLIQPAAKTWVQNELVNSNEDAALICSHQGPHNYDKFFDKTMATGFSNMIISVLNDKPGFKVYHVFGHEHPSDVKLFSNLRYLGYGCPPVLDFYIGKFTDMYVLPNGQIKTYMRYLDYY